MKIAVKLINVVTDPTLLIWAVSLGTIKSIVEKYIFSDWEFLMFLVVLVACDTILGFYKAWKSKTIESKAWGQVIEKFLLYSMVLIVANVLTKFTVNGDTSSIFNWIDDVFFGALLVREAISILENIGEIKPDFLPAWILKRLKKFDDSGKVKDLIDE